MTTLTIAWFGDVVGKPGRLALARALDSLRAAGRAELFLANAENARHGRGLHPAGYEELRAAGLHAMTLGDHAQDDARVLPLLEDPDHPLVAPANLPGWASAKRSLEIVPGVHVVPCLGRLFMKPEIPSPFEALDDRLATIVETQPEAIVLVEVHAEATSEKAAVLWHCRERWSDTVLGVVGSHTHVQTSDARIVDGRTAAMSDLGMCGASRGVIGFTIAPSLDRFREVGRPPLDVAEADPVAEGCLITLDLEARRAVEMTPFRLAAE